MSEPCAVESAAAAGETATAGEPKKARQHPMFVIAQSMPTLNNPWYVLFANGSKRYGGSPRRGTVSDHEPGNK